MLKRKIMDQLINWKDSNDKKCLLIEGSRQTGKTYIINKFLNTYFDEKYIIKIDFLKNTVLHKYFDFSLDVDYLIKNLETYFINDSKRFEANKTIIFFDEIQECPSAITSLKYFCEDSRFMVIATGSLLGLGYKKVKSFPVGKVQRITLYPLDFEEFLWANNINIKFIDEIKTAFDTKSQVPELLHNKMNELFHNYIVVGGMPEVVEKYVETNNFNEVLNLQKMILNDYKDDIAKYSDNSIEKIRARECFDSIPKQLGKKNKKFQYSVVKPKGRFSEYSTSLRWLIDAGFIIKVNNLNAITNSLSFEEDDSCYKIYLHDFGLLMPMIDEASRFEIYNGSLDTYKGGIYESVVASQLIHKYTKLYYYSPNENIENEFVFSRESKIYLLEVKAGKNTKSISFDKMINEYQLIGIKISSKNIGYNERFLTIPHYMIFLL